MRIHIVLFRIGFLVWAIETIYFLIAYGWHIETININEQRWDIVAQVFLSLSIGLWVIKILRIIK
jgi:hypothetical protein